MTPEAQQAAIAQACGKRELKSCGLYDRDHDFWATDRNSIGAWVLYCNRCDARRVCSMCGHDAFWSIDEDSEKFTDVKAPDYLNDLNAMREAELKCIVGNFELHSGDETVEQFYKRQIGAFSAAHYRANVFLRALNLWKSES